MKLKVTMELYEKHVIMDELRQHRWHQGKTAAALGINQVTLHLKMKKHGLLRSQQMGK